MGRQTYYIGRALGRAVVREKNRADRVKEREMKNNPELFNNYNNSSTSSVWSAIIFLLIALVLSFIFLINT